MFSPNMGPISTEPEANVAYEVPPYLVVLKDGTIKRVAGIGNAPPGKDPQTGVTSKDITIVPETGIKARLYRPEHASEGTKMPLVVYFHGGAFCVATVAEPLYHNSMNIFAKEAKVVIVAVDYRLAPEHPLPAAYEDCWAALQWVASHADGNRDEEWLENVDFNKVFLAGDSAGANIVHHLGIRAKSDPISDLNFHGMLMINPYFWGKDPIGLEQNDPNRKTMVDCWWKFVCPSDKGSDDPLINPFVGEASCISNLACKRVFVCVAENDILRDRGILYYEKLVKSKWTGSVELKMTKGEDHDFHIFNPTCDKALDLVKRWGSFINKV